MQMYRSISVLILLQEIVKGTVVKIAERSTQRPLSRGPQLCTRFGILPLICCKHTLDTPYFLLIF